MLESIASVTLAAVLTVFGFLLRRWVESMSSDLRDHMIQEENLRIKETELQAQFREDVHTQLRELRQDIRAIHSRIDSLMK